MLTADEEYSFRMDTEYFIGCAIAAADSINDDDDQTVGCTIVCAADPSRSNSEESLLQR